jgi:flagellar M-ring protein FliF
LAMQQAAVTQVRDEALETMDSGIYEKIEKHARRKPEDVAKVLKTWLSED